MQTGIQSFESFLASLAQVTGTLLAILFGLVGAYYVFLKERNSRFDDEIAQKKLEIRDTLTTLRKAWRTPPSLYASLPPDFEGHIKSRYPNVSDADLFRQVLGDLAFDGQQLTELQAELLNSAPYVGPWKGRVYYWLIGKTVDVLTLRLPALESLPSTVAPTIPQGVFPIEATGLGYDDWRTTYAPIREAATFFSGGRQLYESDYSAFTSSRTDGLSPETRNEIFRVSVAAFYDALAELNAQLDGIDRNTILSRRYAASRLHPTSLLILASLSALVGIALPLALLACPAVRLTTEVAIALLLATIAFLGAAYFRLARDVASEPKEDRAEYLRARWYRPLLAELKSQEQALDSAGFVDGSPFDSALRSKDSNSFPEELRQRLRAVVDQAKTLKDSGGALNRRVLLDMRSNERIKDLLRPAGSEGGVTLAPTDLAEATLFENWRANYEKAGLATIKVQTRGPSWSRDEATIPKPGTQGEKGELIRALSQFQTDVGVVPEAASFRTAKQNLNETIEGLRDLLRGELARQPSEPTVNPPHR